MTKSLRLSGPKDAFVNCEIVDSTGTLFLTNYRDHARIRIRKEDIPKLRDWLNELKREEERSTPVTG